jgi:hypothetical protein
MIDFKALAAPFPPSAVSWRVGRVSEDKRSALCLAYLDARDIMDRFDSVCGPGGWQCRYSHVGNITVCEIGVKVGDEWLWKADGAGQSDIEAEKGALSDALKRAAVRWGPGRYLYSLGNTYAKVVPAGRSFRIDPAEYPKLNAILERHAKGLPAAPDIVAEAKAIHAEQSAERAQQGLKPLRKPKPTRREWADYALEDIKDLDVEGIRTWTADNSAKMEQLFDQNHSIWVEIDTALSNRLASIRMPV